MVDSIGPSRISVITRTKAVNAGKVDKPGRDKDRRGKGGKGGTGQGLAEADKRKGELGANVDEHC